MWSPFLQLALPAHGQWSSQMPTRLNDGLTEDGQTTGIENGYKKSTEYGWNLPSATKETPCHWHKITQNSKNVDHPNSDFKPS
jgi:hypothetical protein